MKTKYYRVTFDVTIKKKGHINVPIDIDDDMLNRSEEEIKSIARQKAIELAKKDEEHPDYSEDFHPAHRKIHSATAVCAPCFWTEEKEVSNEK